MSEQLRVLGVGSCIYDILCFVRRMPSPGESLVVDKSVRRLGGKGFNQAVGLARLGCAVSFAAGVGSDALADVFGTLAAAERIDFRPDRVPSAPTGVAVPIVTPDGVSSILVDVGAAMHMRISHVESALLAKDWDAVLCHYEVPPECLRAVFDQCHKRRIPVFCNPAPWLGQDAITFAREADVLVLNTVEARHLATAVGWSSGSSPDDLARACASACRAQLVVLTLGSEGSIAVHDGGLLHCQSLPGEIVDSTGAGDAFCAGVVFGVLRGWEIGRTLALATGAATYVCGKPGGAESMPLLSEAIRLAQSHPLWSTL